MVTITCNIAGVIVMNRAALTVTIMVPYALTFPVLIPGSFNLIGRSCCPPHEILRKFSMDEVIPSYFSQDFFIHLQWQNESLFEVSRFFETSFQGTNRNLRLRYHRECLGTTFKKVKWPNRCVFAKKYNYLVIYIKFLLSPRYHGNATWITSNFFGKMCFQLSMGPITWRAFNPVWTAESPVWLKIKILVKYSKQLWQKFQPSLSSSHNCFSPGWNYFKHNI